MRDHRLYGLPVKPALRDWAIYYYYELDHGHLPGGRAHTKRLRAHRKAVIYRWWRRLHPTRRKQIAAEISSSIADFNAERERLNRLMQKSLHELRMSLVRLRCEESRQHRSNLSSSRLPL